MFTDSDPNEINDFKKDSEEALSCVDLDYLNSTKAYKYIQKKCILKFPKKLCD